MSVAFSYDEKQKESIQSWGGLRSPRHRRLAEAATLISRRLSEMSRADAMTVLALCARLIQGHRIDDPNLF